MPPVRQGPPDPDGCEPLRSAVSAFAADGAAASTSPRHPSASPAAELVLEVRHHLLSEKLEGAERLLVGRAAEVDLHRRLDCAEGIDAAADLSRDFLRRAYECAAAGDDLVGRGGENAGDHLVVARILVRRLALPGLHRVGEGLQVAPADALEPGLRLGALLGDIGELRHLHLLGARLVARLAPYLAV